MDLTIYVSVSVNRVSWSPDGLLFGVAYSRQILQIYSYHGGGDARQHLEIHAHDGGVNDVAFFHSKNQLCVITCGDDKTVKVWDAETGIKKYTFEGHNAPVYSICTRYKENNQEQFIFSMALDGNIRAWLFDDIRSRVHYDVPGGWYTTMRYSLDGTRLFSCGISKEGESYMLEWDECEGAVKRSYLGFCNRCLGAVHFDTTNNCVLAAGDDFTIKYWDMNNAQLLTTVVVDGGLPARSFIRFNKDGCLLAISANNNDVKILANSDGLQLLPLVENFSYDTTSRETEVKPSITEEPHDKSNIWKLKEISESAQCRSLELPENMKATKISRLTYTNKGDSILILASNAVHLLWKWPGSEYDSNGRATTSVLPQLQRQPSGALMINDAQSHDPEEFVSCFALSKNDSYVVSASGGKISLFNLFTFEKMTHIIPWYQRATFIALHPLDNNIIAIGMDDSTIRIYNIQMDEEIDRVEGHSKRITGLSFSHVLNVLVSSGADALVCVWSSDRWEKRKARYLEFPPGRISKAQFDDTWVQFHPDQIHFFVAHETQLAIYETTRLECLKQWVPDESSAPISHATFSCDGQLIYSSFLDGSVCVFTASHLYMRCRINSNAYLSPNVPSNSNVHPLVIAGHPQEVNQFSLGLSDGRVYVLEPNESEGKWGVEVEDDIIDQCSQEIYQVAIRYGYPANRTGQPKYL